MSRPHSREKRVSDSYSSVEKQSFNNDTHSSNKSRGVNSSKRSFFRPSFSVRPSFSSGNRRGGISKIIGLIIVAYILIQVVGPLFSNLFSSGNSQTPITQTSSNAYIDNHNVNHISNTSSNDVNYDVASGTRNKYTKIIGNNQDEVTVMVYMIGSNLESQSRAATKDITEMVYSQMESNINLIIETGGAKTWNNNVVSNKRLERYSVTADGLYRLDTNIKNESMTNPEALSSFIKYTADNFPANRYILILWDHGGGSVTGYGMDEKYPNSPSMSPDTIASALKDGGVKFDVVGFDACLMANLETALAIEPYADYLIASEETEPADGWYYTNFIKTLDSNTSIQTVDLAKQIIDDYVSTSLSNYRTSEATLSVIDLGELAYNINQPLTKFSKSVSNKLEGDEYQQIANARGNTKEFSKSSRLDQVDLVDLAINFNVDGSDDMVKAIKQSVKYNRTANITDSYGLSAYFPYSSLSKMNEMVKIYDNINIDEEYSNVVKSFATYASSGQIVTSSSGSSNTSIFDILMGNNYPGSSYSQNSIYDILTDSYSGSYGYDPYSSIFGSGYDSWLDPSMFRSISRYMANGKQVDGEQLNVVTKNGNRVVSLSDSQWDLIDNVLLNVYIDDGEGYIDMGLDNVFEWSEDGDLIIDYDGTWLAINNHFIPYYMVSDVYVNDSDYKTTGKVPAYLNGERVDIMISFTPEKPYGIVEGAKPILDNSDCQQKGLIEIKDGDVIDFICNYYHYDGIFDDEYRLGDSFVVDGPLELYNVHITNDYMYTYCFQDVYGNKLWTPKTNK